MIGVTFHKTGNWFGITAALHRLPAEVISSTIWGMRKASENLVDIVKGHIDNQDLGWAPLSPTTISGDPRILVDTEAYRDAIVSFKSGDMYYAGVKPDSYNTRGISISEIARAHESGTSRVPARPLWGPSFEEMGGKRGIKSIVIASIWAKVKLLESQGLQVKLNNIV